MVIFHSYVSLPEGSHLWVKPQFLHVAYHKKSYLEDPGAMTKDSALMTFVQDAALATELQTHLRLSSTARLAAGASLEISLILSPCGILCLFGGISGVGLPVPFWVYWTSSYRPYTIHGWVM